MSAFRVCLATSFVLLFVFCSTAFAETVFNVRDLGVEGNGVVLDTDAVQKAFDA